MILRLYYLLIAVINCVIYGRHNEKNFRSILDLQNNSIKGTLNVTIIFSFYKIIVIKCVIYRRHHESKLIIGSKHLRGEVTIQREGNI